MIPTKEQLQKYAELIVKVGTNVQEGQTVRLNAQIDQLPLVSAVTEACYKAGAGRVEVDWYSDDISKLHYTYANTETLGTVKRWEEERAKEMTETLPVRIFIDSDDPDALFGIDAEKISTVGQMRRKVLKKYRDKIDGIHQWLIVAAASPSWAKKVFPEKSEDEAVALLWDAIFECTYMNSEDPINTWKEHINSFKQRASWLNSQEFVSLHYKSSNGTDFTADLIPNAKWNSAGDINHKNKAFFVPNMPTEEIFTSPLRGHCEGRLVATKPLSWSGQLIEDFTVDFKDGKVSSCTAKVGEDILKKMFSMDEGAAMLGELALVPKESPINTCGILFFNTLFDENACCHVAVGAGFPEVLDGFLEMSKEEQTKRGINDSMIHTDFMIGSDDLDIVGIKKDGSEIQIFKNGTWAV